MKSAIFADYILDCNDNINEKIFSNKNDGEMSVHCALTSKGKNSCRVFNGSTNVLLKGIFTASKKDPSAKSITVC